MSSSVGHALCGITLLVTARSFAPRIAPEISIWSCAVAVVLANLPDSDFLLGYVLHGDANSLHSGPTHSLMFVVAASLFVATVFRQPWGGWKMMPLVAALIASHLVIDSLTGMVLGWHTSYGVPFLWPFEDTRFTFPFTAFPGVEHETFGKVLSLYNVKVMLIEVMTWCPALLILWLGLRRRTSLQCACRS